MIDYNKQEIRNQLSVENIFSLLEEWGGMPEMTNSGITAYTICHNVSGGSRKLYYYSNSNLFHCYTGCAEPSFDIFQLVMKVMELQKGIKYDLNDAVRWVAQRFGLAGTVKEEGSEEVLEDWKILANYDRIQDISIQPNSITLKEYDRTILSRFNYSVKIQPWLDEGISEYAMQLASIGYYAGGNQITIPHFDQDGRFVGLRGRTLSIEDAERYGKYRPLRVNSELYNHPLGMNLYGLNWTKDTISTFGKAIVFESEKSVLKMMSFLPEANMSVACCGSSLSAHQVQLLVDAGAKEIIVAFDRQFQKLGDDEYKRLKNNLIRIHEKYKNYVTISFIFDKKMITRYKDSPIDCGKEKFLQLFKERIIL